MGKSVKVILGLVLGFTLMVAGVLFYASTKINPEEIRKLTISGLEKALPNAQVNLGKIDYSLGFNIKIHFADLSLKLKEDNSDLASVKDFSLKLPIWAILTNGGTVDLNIQNPKLSYIEIAPKITNWSKALGSPEQSTNANEVNKDQAASDKAVAVPTFISKSKINVRISDTDLDYKLASGIKGAVKFNRFVLKDLNLTSTTAFEIESLIDTTLKDNKRFSTQLLVIGQIHLNDFVKEKKIDTKLLLEMSKTSFSGINHKIPDIKSDIKVLMLPNGLINLDLDTTFGSVATNQLKLEMQNKKIDLKSFKLELFLKELNTVLDKTTQASLSKIDFNNANFNLNGSLVLDDSKLVDSNINFGLSSEINIKGAEGLSLTTGLKGRYAQENLLVTISNKVLEGNVNVEIKGKFNPLSENFSPSNLGTIFVDLLATNIKLRPEMIRANLYAKKSDSAQATSEETNGEAKSVGAAAPMKPRAWPHVIVDARWKQIIVGKDEFSGGGKIIVKDSSVASENMVFQFSKGKGGLSFTNRQNASLLTESKFSFNLNGLNLNSLQPFLPPSLESIKGDFTGDVKGALTENKKSPASYDVTFNLSATNGELKGLNMSEHLAQVIAKVDMLKDKLGKKDFKVTDEFEKLIVKGNVNNQELKLAVFDFTGIKNSTSITGSGNVGQPLSKKSSQLDLVYQDKTGAVKDFMQKNIGTDKLPLRLVGQEFALKPDYAFTLSAIAKGAMKTKGKEIVKKEAEKVLDKVLQNDEVKEKAGKLLKGLFK